MAAGAAIGLLGGLLGHVAYHGLCENSCGAETWPVLGFAVPGVVTFVIGAFLWIAARY